MLVFFSSRRRHTRCGRDWSSDVCSSDLLGALADGRLQPGKIILDSSSGNAGYAYAMIGRVLGYPVEIVIPENASLERKKRLLAHGARLTFTDALKGYDEAAPRGSPAVSHGHGALLLLRPVQQSR